MESLNLVFLLYKKELLCLFRDKEILVYGVLLPLLLIPVIGLLVMEAGFCFVGMTELQKTHVAVLGDANSREFIRKQLVGLDNHFAVVEDSAPEEHLKSGALDAIVEAKNHRLELFTVDARDPIEMIKPSIAKSLKSICENSIQEAMSAANVPVSDAQVFDVKNEQVGRSLESPQREISHEGASRLAVALFLALLFLDTMMTASYAMLIPVITEIEQKTLYSALMIPGPRMAIAIAKYLAGFSTTLLSAIQFCFSIVLTAGMISCVIFIQVTDKEQVLRFFTMTAPGVTNSTTGAVETSHNIWPVLLHATHGIILLAIPDISLFTLALALACAVLFAVSAWARSATEGQLLISLPSTIMTFLPLCALLPDLEFNKAALSVPILNLFLLMKSAEVAPLAVVLIVVETLLLVAVCLIVGDYLSMKRNNFETNVPFRRADGV